MNLRFHLRWVFIEGCETLSRTDRMSIHVVPMFPSYKGE